MAKYKEIDFEIMRRLGSKTLAEEWEYFKEYARKYLDNTKDKRYGILPWGAVPSMDNMIYSHDVLELRREHLIYIMTEGGSNGMKVRRHLDWIERLGRKQ